MSTMLTVVGLILLIAGLVFVGQGSGYFPHPASSFMVGQVRWVYYGGSIAAAGVVLLLLARKW